MLSPFEGKDVPFEHKFETFVKLTVKVFRELTRPNFISWSRSAYTLIGQFVSVSLKYTLQYILQYT